MKRFDIKYLSVLIISALSASPMAIASDSTEATKAAAKKVQKDNADGIDPVLALPLFKIDGNIKNTTRRLFITKI